MSFCALLLRTSILQKRTSPFLLTHPLSPQQVPETIIPRFLVAHPLSQTFVPFFTSWLAVYGPVIPGHHSRPFSFFSSLSCVRSPSLDSPTHKMRNNSHYRKTWVRTHPPPLLLRCIPNSHSGDVIGIDLGTTYCTHFSSLSPFAGHGAWGAPVVEISLWT